MIGRRGFLKVLGITPLAARASAEKAAADISMRGWSVPPLAETVENMAQHGGGLSIGGDRSENPYVRMRDYVRLMGKFPDYVEAEMRRQAKRVDHIDPDIAVKKSWSFAVKIQAQRERNYERQVESAMSSGAWAEAQKAFSQITGFEWRW